MQQHQTKRGRGQRSPLRLPLKLAGLASACLMAAAPAHAIDVDAGDYTALPPGTNVGLLYYQHAERDKIYARGNRVADGNLDSDVGILRYVHFMSIGGFTVDPQILLPFGSLRGTDNLSALGSGSGVADPILAASVWLVNDPQKKRYFGITPFIYIPVGSYDKNKALNLGENRWKFALQAGYITPLTDKITLDLIGDVTVFGNNNKFGPGEGTLKQDALVQTQAWLRYNITPTFDVRAGFSYAFGGKTKVNGVAQDDNTNTSKFSFGFAWFPAPTLQVLGTYGRDISVRNGPMESNRFNLRVLKLF
ncbi:transporter [Burkholderia multivorans]|uniref:transporter n=1 Tax=Burkholderia multivorans TaxID=87883 RepID=UPI0004F7D0FB|nr:transporter [Burkholderia multivorans]AIO73013.1 metA-pathway of phenol degradation family protein [Burkholderia multivorans]